MTPATRLHIVVEVRIDGRWVEGILEPCAELERTLAWLLLREGTGARSDYQEDIRPLC